MKLNQSGSTQLFLCLLLLMSLSGLTAITLNKVIIYKKNRIRLMTLLCLRKSHFYQSKFINDINLANRLIQFSFYTSKVPNPKISIPAKIALNSLKAKQQVDLAIFYKNIYKIKECSKITRANIALNSIYKMKGKVIFKRNFDDTTSLVSKKKKDFLYFSSEKTTIETPPIIFKSTFNLDNHFDRKVKVLTKGYEI
ncbi:hypothetical protein [Halobacteriovorax sp.]|uniref:hypothetical protein n=1 Tax=Halobacteriovorax sp. TaxID=2020862 RepID=UPI0035624B66